MLPRPYDAFLADCHAILPKERVYTDALRTLAYGTDASFYRLIPKIVCDALNEDEVRALLRLAAKHGVSLTFRAAGTSLSGQAVTDSVLVRLGHGWKGCRINADASAISLQPGVIGAEANTRLAPLGKKIGPDPASIDTCMIGGIFANNASGMCCGTADNSYKTLLSGRFILADGTLLDTGDAASTAAFARTHAHILEGLAAMRGEIMADRDLAERIRRKFTIKNTMGYSINALVDYEDPVDILQHLMVGSEGTLGFIAEVSYRTVEELPFKASSLMLFPSVHAACEASALLGAAEGKLVDAVELMDRGSLKSAEGQEGIRDLGFLDEHACSLLVETRAMSGDALDRQILAIVDVLKGAKLLEPVAFTSDPAASAALWKIRKGILPSAGAQRKSGTSSLIEDVAVPLERLAETALDLQGLFKRHGYLDASLFGHALDGNLHFCFAQDFSSPAEVDRYRAFMDDIGTLIAEKYEGSLKAEHGTGRNMAPFVELEWGSKAYAVMSRIKKLFDPGTLLNPGVIINPDPAAHVTHLKALRPTHELIDSCTECGFCEPTCPSRRLTLTPRQRIATWREVQHSKDEGYRDTLLRAMAKSYTYQGRETCAVDGLCSLRCPTGINTGTFIKHLRGIESGKPAHTTADFARRHFGVAARSVSATLDAVNLIHSIFGTRVMQTGSDLLRTLTRKNSPAWNKAMPKGGGKLPRPSLSPDNPNKVVYFPACISRNMGPDLASPDRRTEPEMAVSLLRKAGYDVIYPENVTTLCCGTVFESKGFKEQADASAKELSDALLAASQNGLYPVLVDTSPCLLRMRETMDKRISLYDPVALVLDHLADRLTFTRLPRVVALHVTCSSRRMGLTERMKDLASRCAEEVILPEGIDCCGFAGDRGFTHPELNATALLDLRRQVTRCTAGYSTSRTCEIGLTLHSGIPYYSILSLLDEASVSRY